MDGINTHTCSCTAGWTGGDCSTSIYTILKASHTVVLFYLNNNKNNTNKNINNNNDKYNKHNYNNDNIIHVIYKMKYSIHL